MLIVEMKNGLTIDRALKILKGKVARTKIMKELRERQEFVKPSIKKRDQIKKAVYIQKLKQEEEDDK